MNDLNKNRKSSRELDPGLVDNPVKGESDVDSKDSPLYKALVTAHNESFEGNKNGLNGKKKVNGNGSINGSGSVNGNGHYNGNGSMNGKSVNGNGSLNANGSVNGNGSTNGNGYKNGNSYKNGSVISNGTVNGKSSLNDEGFSKDNNFYPDLLSANSSEIKNNEKSEVFKGIKYLNTDDQSFSFSIEKPRYVVLVVTNRLTMREEVLVNQLLMPGDYMVMLNRDEISPGFHYYKLYYEADGSTTESYRFNDIRPDLRFYLQTIKEVTVL